VVTCQKAAVAAGTAWAAANMQQLILQRQHSTGNKKAIINSKNAAADAVLTWVLRRKATCLGKTTKGAFDGQGEVMKKEASMANARMK